MAEVTVAARAARGDAARLRNETQELKLSVRGNLARSRKRLGKAQLETDRARARRAVPCASPWSGLQWLLEDDSLERILFPVD
jgi:hypothetical protein